MYWHLWPLVTTAAGTYWYLLTRRDQTKAGCCDLDALSSTQFLASAHRLPFMSAFHEFLLKIKRNVVQLLKQFS